MRARWGILVAAALLALAGLGWRLRGEAPPAAVPRGAAPVSPAAFPPPAKARDLPPASPSPVSPSPILPTPAAARSLLVRDAATKAPLAGARVFAHHALTPVEDGPTPDPDCVAGAVPGMTDSSGRLPVPAGGDLRLHAVAPGHRWAVAVATEEGLVADLAPGSAVRLSVGRWGDLEEPLLFAERGSVAEGVDPAVPAAEVAGGGEAEVAVEAAHPVPAPAPGKETTLDEGIEPGTWTYFVRRGLRDGEIYARGIVTVAEGETADLRLDAVPMTAGPRVPVRVVAIIPKRWGVGGFDVEVAQDAFIPDPGPFISLKGLDPLNRHLEAGTFYFEPDEDGDWRALLRPDLPAGRYRARVEPPGWTTEVTVSGPAPEVRLELPEPGEVRVTLLDAATGKPVPNGWVRWAPEWKGHAQGYLESLAVDAATGAVVLRAPPGSCHADLGADGYLDGERTLSFVAGSTAEVKATLRQAAVLVVRLRLDGKSFEGDASVQAEMKADEKEMARLFGESETGGVVTAQSSTTSTGEVRLDGLWGGPHEITVTGLEGFEPVPPRRVELRFGTETVVEFDLVRVK